MTPLLRLLLLLVMACGVQAQNLPTAATSARSMSGQFFIVAPPPPLLPRPAISTNTPWIQLEPTWVAISAERIKQTVWRDLGITGPWRQRVAIALRPDRAGDDLVTIISTHAPDGWSYRLDMPDRISREHYMRAMVQVVLLELANRHAADRSAEIPAWLSEGLAFQLLANNSTELILTPPTSKANGVAFTTVSADFHPLSPLEKAHKILLGTVPLTYEELSWPEPGLFEGEEGGRYGACAQLFTEDLLRLPNGPACMQAFIADLPVHLNWQISFLEGFQSHFSRPLEVEKWWALQAAAFTGRDLIQKWSYEESWNRLATAIREPVEVHLNTNQLPVHSDVSLQTIIGEWDAAKQRATLSMKVVELDSLRYRIAPELIALSTEYGNALRSYLNQLAPRIEGKPLLKQARREAIQHLDALDLQLEKMKIQPASGKNESLSG
jgi:hypothetical protein